MIRHLSAVPDLPPDPWEVRQARDLPGQWDGHDVTWGDWYPDTSAVFHLPLHETACHRCGGVGGHRHSTGTYWADPEGGVLTISGLLHPAGQRRLLASRCRDCGMDHVTELERGSWEPGATWDLEESDYGPDGSWPEGQGTLL